MRIAYDGVALLGPRFGIGHYADRLIRAVARADRGAQCVVVCPWPVNPFRPLPTIAFEEPNIEVPQPAWPTRVHRRMRELAGGPLPLEDLVGPVDVFHGPNYLLTHPTRRARRVVTIHDLTVVLFPQWHPTARLREMRTRLRTSAEAADRIIAVSQSTKKDIVEHLAVDADRIAVVPLAVDSSFRPLPRAAIDATLGPLGLSAENYVLFLGTIEPRKNVTRLLEAMSAAGPDVGPLVLAGGEGWGSEDLRLRLSELQARGRVRVAGYVSDELRQVLLAGARMLVYPSLYEGFGLPPLEAMACDTPVITSAVSSLPEVVGDAAVLVDPLDVDGLARAIRRLWDDETLRSELRRRGLARARGFTWEATARGTLEVYAATLRR